MANRYKVLVSWATVLMMMFSVLAPLVPTKTFATEGFGDSIVETQEAGEPEMMPQGNKGNPQKPPKPDDLSGSYVTEDAPECRLPEGGGTVKVTTVNWTQTWKWSEHSWKWVLQDKKESKQYSTRPATDVECPASPQPAPQFRDVPSNPVPVCETGMMAVTWTQQSAGYYWSEVDQDWILGGYEPTELAPWVIYSPMDSDQRAKCRGEAPVIPPSEWTDWSTFEFSCDVREGKEQKTRIVTTHVASEDELSWVPVEAIEIEYRDVSMSPEARAECDKPTILFVCLIYSADRKVEVSGTFDELYNKGLVDKDDDGNVYLVDPDSSKFGKCTEDVWGIETAMLACTPEGVEVTFTISGSEYVPEDGSAAADVQIRPSLDKSPIVSAFFWDVTRGNPGPYVLEIKSEDLTSGSFMALVFKVGGSGEPAEADAVECGGGGEVTPTPTVPVTPSPTETEPAETSTPGVTPDASPTATATTPGGNGGSSDVTPTPATEQENLGVTGLANTGSGQRAVSYTAFVVMVGLVMAAGVVRQKVHKA